MTAPGKGAARHLTVRNVPARVAQALEYERRRRGTSLNQTVIDLLTRALGVEPGNRRSNGLATLGGRWTGEQFAEFEAAAAPAEQIDEELWR